MKTIHKYVLTETENRVLSREGAYFLHVAEQHGQITVWAEVDTTAPECPKTLYVVGTGHVVPPETVHVGSLLLEGGNFVFHVYEAVGQ